MKKFLTLGLAIASVGMLNTLAAKNLAINNQDYAVDTMIVRHQVGPGTTYAYYRAPARPLEIHALEIDLSNPYINLEVWNGGQAAVASETPSHVGQRYTNAGVDVVAVHNGDFYTTTVNEVGMSRMGLIGAGEWLFNATGQPLICFDNDGVPRIDYINFSGLAVRPDKVSARIHTVNQLRLEWEPESHANQLSLYTPAFGTNMHTASSGGTVVTLEPVNGSNIYPANVPLSLRVVSVVENPGKAPIPADGCVLHGVGTSAEFLSALKEGDVVTTTLSAIMVNNPDVKTFHDAIGGSGHIILRNGDLLNIGNADCHPRTFMGISQDRKTIYSVVVDGRYSGSAGITLDDQGEVLRWLGAWDGINLDGGGSSCMVVNGTIRNHNSDGNERAVGNGVIFYSSAPKDDVTTKIALEPGDWRLPVGARVSPKVFGFNQYDYMIDTDFTDFTLSCDPEIGSISEDGKTFIAATTPAKGSLTAGTPDGKTSTVTVSIVDVAATADVTSYIVDKRRDYGMSFTAAVGAHKYEIESGSINWTSSDPTIATVANGRVRGVNNGTTTLIGTSGHFNDTITVTTENVDGDSRSIFTGLTADDLSLSISGGKNLTATPNGNGFKLTYTGNGSSRGANAQISGPKESWKTYGLPDAIRLTINPGDTPIKSIAMNYTTNDGKRGTLTFSDSEVPANTTTTYVVDLNSIFDVTDNINYPITFASLRFMLGTSTKNTEYTITIDSFEMDYTGQGGVDDITIDTPAKTDDNTLYNLNGVPAPQNPVPGIYIKADGTKVRL